ncbi:MAG: hypothetical protein F6K11_09230 [Leptolyngbya sp. SIO3F4]|nr:hypothetical protein [Leptolyngbya sp. SIO3F4]
MFARGGMGLLLAELVAEAILTPTETALLWGLHHPYWSVAIAIALIIALQLSISVIGQLLRRSLKWLGKSPLFLGRWLLTKTSLTPGADGLSEQQIIVLLTRLESLQQEQANLLAELQASLKTRGINQGE